MKMKFLFRSSNKHAKSAAPSPVTSTVPTYSQHLRETEQQQHLEQQQHYHHPQHYQHQHQYHDDTVATPFDHNNNNNVKKPKHRKGRQKQRKRRESLVDMAVPPNQTQSRTPLSSSIMSSSTASTVVTGFASGTTSSAGPADQHHHQHHASSKASKKPVKITLSNSSNRSRATEASSTTMSTRSSSIMTYRTSTSTTVHSSITTRGSMWSATGSPSFVGSMGQGGRAVHMIKSQTWGSHRSLDDNDDNEEQQQGGATEGDESGVASSEQQYYGTWLQDDGKQPPSSIAPLTSLELQSVDEQHTLSYHERQLQLQSQPSSESASSSSSSSRRAYTAREEQSEQSSTTDTRGRDTVTVGTAVSAISGISMSLYESSSHHAEHESDHRILGPLPHHQAASSSVQPLSLSTAPAPLSSSLLVRQQQAPTTGYLDTSATDPQKDHAFQLVPNIHKELGMLHRDFNSIKEATTHFLLSCPQDKRLKPILSLDVELPGNLHAGRTIFSHPLIVEAIEMYFAVVTTPHDTLPQEFHANFVASSSNKHHDGGGSVATAGTANTSCSKMRGNYLYTRIRILDPLTGCDLVPCVDDRQLSRAALLQAMMDALAMVCPDQPMPRYLTNLLEEEQATIHAAALYHRRQDLNYYYGATTTTIIAEQQHHHHHHPLGSHHNEEPQAPMAVFGLEHTALGEVVFAELEGVLSTRCGWVIPQLSSSSKATTAAAPANTDASSSSNTEVDHTPQPPDRQAVVLVSYDPHRLSYCTLAKFAVQQHALQRLGRPSCLTFYYTSHEQQVTAQMHTKAHYRQLIAQVDPNNPAQHYYNSNNNNNNGSFGGSMRSCSTRSCSSTSSSCPPSSMAHETIRIIPLQQRDHNGEPLQRDNNNDGGRSSSRRRNAGIAGGGGKNTSHSSASSTGSSSEESLTGIIPTDNTKNNSKNKTHPGYKVPNYDGVVAHAAAKAAAEAAAAKDTAPRYSFVLKTMCGDSLQLQCSKPALRESHLRFVPLTPFQATRANQLVYQGKFHLAMKLLSPRQGMVLMHALRSGRPKRCITCVGNPPVITAGTTPARKQQQQAPKANNKATSPKKASPNKPKSTTTTQTKPATATRPTAAATSSNNSKSPTKKGSKGSSSSPPAGSKAGGKARRVSAASIESASSATKPSPTGSKSSGKGRRVSTTSIESASSAPKPSPTGSAKSGGKTRRVSTASVESAASAPAGKTKADNSKKTTPKRRSSAKPVTTSPNSKAVQPGGGASSAKSPAPNTRRLRRVATADGGLSPSKRFPRQTPRMSLNTEALKASVSAAAASLQADEEEAAAATRRSSRRSSRNSVGSSVDPSPPVATIDTSKSSSSSSYQAAATFQNSRIDIEYRDVVDIPILEAWKAFVILPEGADGEDDDDSYLWGMNDVYSQDEDRAYYTSDDYSIGS